MSALVYTTCFGALIIYLLLKWKRVRTKYLVPKGPLGVPLLGNLLQMIKNPHIRLSQWAEQYGNLYTIYLGTRPALVLSDVQSQKELFNQQVATGKFKNDTFLLLSRGPFGIINTEGSAWAEQRQFCLRNLVRLGFGNKRLEPLILSDCQELIHLFNVESQKAVDGAIEINQILKLATNNTLMTMLKGERIRLTDQTVNGLLEEFIVSVQNTVKTGLGFYPWLKHVAPVASGYVALDQSTKKLHQYFEHVFEKHEKTNASRENDMIGAYIEKVAETSDSTSSFYGELAKTNSIASVVELFIAGAETTSASVTWFLYYVALHPDVQEKTHEELDSILGGKEGRDPSLEDKSQLVYTEAVILEVMRIRPVAPLGIMHELLADVEFNGYWLPKGMLLIANIYHCHHDKTVWKDPENFRPERFINAGNKIDNRLKDLIVPFQVGKRSCLGEPLAKDVMFLFVTKLLHEFQISPIPGISEEEYFDPDVGQGLLPKPRKVVLKCRSKKI